MEIAIATIAKAAYTIAIEERLAPMKVQQYKWDALTNYNEQQVINCTVLIRDLITNVRVTTTAVDMGNAIRAWLQIFAHEVKDDNFADIMSMHRRFEEIVVALVKIN